MYARPLSPELFSAFQQCQDAIEVFNARGRGPVAGLVGFGGAMGGKPEATAVRATAIRGKSQRINHLPGYLAAICFSPGVHCF